MHRLFLFTFLLIIFSFAGIGQDTIVGWTFPDEDPEISVLANYGIKENINNSEIKFLDDLTGLPGNILMEPVFPNPVEDFKAIAKGWQDGFLFKYWYVEINAENYTNIMISSEQSSDTEYPGPRFFKLQYLGCGQAQ
ncbi:MAG: hypothetical protein K8R53_05315, partial [Bacteroidales bacterium]|nr:hypothetical protein [Bacteroidales bacterium]